MDAAYFWQKAATCLRLAQTLSSSNPGRVALLDMAQSFERRAREIDAAKTETARTGRSHAQNSQSGLETIQREIRVRHRFG
jgi:hypothetical protein